VTRPSTAIDVLILGGGPAGCATALSLLAAGLAPAQVLVVEASDYASDRIGESIPPDTRVLLAELGVLDSFLAERHEPCHGSASSWGDDALGYNDFLFSPYGHGWHLDRRRFDAWLAAQVEARGVALRRGMRFSDVHEAGPAGACVSLGRTAQLGERVTARFVVDATGSRSRYATRLGAKPRVLDMLVSVSAQFELGAHAGFAALTLLEAVDYGWWYAAKLPRDRVAVAVASSHVLHKQRRFDDPRAWLEALAHTRHVGPRLADGRPLADTFNVCTAPSYVLDRAWGDHWLAVGDAASAFDPISSQGIYKALADGLRGGQAIAATLRGDQQALAHHQRELELRFTRYAQQRASFYAQEQRWPDATFWQQRRAASMPDVPT
jgi:flavin-dependent dehydrogenase